MPQRIIMFNYEELTKELVEKGIPNEDIFRYYDTPYEFQFQDVLNTWQTFMSYYEDELGIAPSRVYFTTTTSVNAKAGPRLGYNLIEMNSGVIVGTSQFFERGKERLDKNGLTELLYPSVHFYDPVENLMRDFSVRFFFDHEFGHLLQKSVSGDNLAEEEYPIEPTDKIDVITSHLKEFDSDYRGTLGVASVILDYWKNMAIKGRNDKSLSLLTSMGIASLLCSFSELLGIDAKFYLRQQKHPHPLVRINYIIHFLKEIFLSQEDVKIDWNVALENAILLTKEAFIDNNSKFNIAFGEMNKEYQRYIIKYINELKTNVKNVSYLGILNPKSFQTKAIDERRLMQLQTGKLSNYTRIATDQMKYHFRNRFDIT